MLVLRLSKASAVPLFKQICRRIAALIDEGTLAEGDRLPPTRVLARMAGVHRSTAVEAYAELRALGYLDSRQGAYSTVRRRARPVPSPIRGSTRKPLSGDCLIDWSTRCHQAVAAAYADNVARSRIPVTRPHPIDFMRLRPDPRLAPCDDLRRCIRKVLAGQAGEVVDYGDGAGNRSLRSLIATRMRTHGIELSPDQIVITAGAQQGMDLVLRMLTRPGERVAVESPTYALALSLLRLHGLEAVPIPVGADGMDLELLDRELDRRPVKLVYTMPNFQNPTGITTSQAHRERLLSSCEARRVPILEDGFEEEMKYFGQAVLPIKSMDERGVVLYLGSLSKVVFPGLRVGWVAAPPEASSRLAAIQSVASLGGNTLAQAAIARLYAGGDYETYLRRLHRIYRKRMQVMLQSLSAHLPATIRFTRPAGGCTVWLTLPCAASAERAICDRLARNGVLVSEGSQYFPRCPAHAHIRLSIASVDDQQILEGCRRLGRVLG